MLFSLGKSFNITMEHRKKIQHVCATSRYALPVTLIYSVLMLLPAIGINIANQVLAFLLITVATFLMVEPEQQKRTDQNLQSNGFMLIPRADDDVKVPAW